MLLSKTSKYALRVLGYMAKDEERLYSAEQLYAGLSVPKQYLRRLLTNLSKAGLIRSTQGRSGGFSLAKAASEIYLADIVKATDGLKILDGCMLGYSQCAFSSPCAMHRAWDETRNSVLKTLNNTTLYDLAKNTLGSV